jgi:large subunit ribosomal protein L3
MGTEIGIVGKKCGMTHVFTVDGACVPVTVVEVQPNKITQIKTAAVDGYSAIQIAADECKASHNTKPLAGHLSKAAVSPSRWLLEFRLDDAFDFAKNEGLKLGAELTVKTFAEGQMVDVRGLSKGKGYAGVMKRWNFQGQPASHGNSLSHRAPGSIGMRQTPRKVYKNKKMAGRMGNESCVIQNQQIVKIDAERNLLFIQGGIPGAPGGKVVVLPAVKRKNKGE